MNVGDLFDVNEKRKKKITVGNGSVGAPNQGYTSWSATSEEM